MKTAGFNGIDFAIHEQTNLLVNLVSRCPVPPVGPEIVNILVPDKHSKWAMDVVKQFTLEGHQVTICTLDQQAPPNGGDTIALLDAIKAIRTPVIEVHLSDPKTREEFRHRSYVGMAAAKTVEGHGAKSYLIALEAVASGEI